MVYAVPVAQLKEISGHSGTYAALREMTARGIGVLWHDDETALCFMGFYQPPPEWPAVFDFPPVNIYIVPADAIIPPEVQTLVSSESYKVFRGSPLEASRIKRSVRLRNQFIRFANDPV